MRAFQNDFENYEKTMEIRETIYNSTIMSIWVGTVSKSIRFGIEYHLELA